MFIYRLSVITCTCMPIVKSLLNLKHNENNSCAVHFMLTLIYVELDSSQLQAVCMLDMISVI